MPKYLKRIYQRADNPWVLMPSMPHLKDSYSLILGYISKRLDLCWDIALVIYLTDKVRERR